MAVLGVVTVPLQMLFLNKERLLAEKLLEVRYSAYKQDPSGGYAMEGRKAYGTQAEAACVGKTTESLIATMTQKKPSIYQPRHVEKC